MRIAAGVVKFRYQSSQGWLVSCKKYDSSPLLRVLMGLVVN